MKRPLFDRDAFAHQEAEANRPQRPGDGRARHERDADQLADDRHVVGMAQVSIRPAGVALSVRSAHACGGPRLLEDGPAGRSASWRGRYKADRRLRAEFLELCAA